MKPGSSRSLIEALLWFAKETSLACVTWSGPELARASASRIRAVDVVLTMLAVALPWSTSAAEMIGIVAVCFILPTIQVQQLLAVLRKPAGALPLVFVVLAAVGTIWAIGVPMPERIGGVGKLLKFLLLPLLLMHFQSSGRAKWVLAAFVGSNFILLAYSFLAFAMPTLSISAKLDQPGVPVKNYIDQSQGFALVAVILLAFAFEVASRQKRNLAIALGVTAGFFLINLIFVNIARTAFVYLPVMLVLLMMRYVDRTKVLAALVGMGLLCAGIWATSPNLQRKTEAIFTELAAFQPSAPIGEREPSAAMRLEFWLKSLKFFEAAPVFGHGTGSTRHLFEEDAIGRTGLSALVVGNPHNQTLAAAVQWGSVGVIVVWAMWLAHLRLFQGGTLIAWIGMLATLQNMLSSIFNSHLMDFYEGWLYVLAVGIAGGQVLRVETPRLASSQARTIATSSS